MKWLSDETLDHLRQVSSEPDLSNTKYRIVKPLGRGGMATVYLVKDVELDREVALKVLDVSESSPALADRMLREASVVARLEHPGIVPIHDVGVLPDGRVFYAMKFVRGDRLDSFVQKTLPERLRAFQRICEAVAFAHSQGVIHRDLKPENIMVGPFGEVLVMDWGLAKVIRGGLEESAGDSLQKGSAGGSTASRIENHSSTDHGTIMGTPSYMAPEQSAGEIEKLNERSDIYSLGAILYYLLTGTNPPESSSDVKSPRAQNSRVAKALDAICTHAMARNQELRYATAMDLSLDVARYLDDLPVSVYRENFFEKTVRWVSRNYFFVLLVLAYLLMRVILILVSNK